MEWLDFGARNYEASLGRWMNLDPLAEQREWLNPYNYVQNSPLIRIDPNGEIDVYIDSVTGKELGRDGRVSDDVRIIDAVDFDDVKTANGGSTISAEATTQLQNSSTLVTVDDAQIQDAAQDVNDRSRTFEAQYNIVLNRDTGVISADLAPDGTDGNTVLQYTSFRDRNNVEYNTSGGNLLIGQIHGHNTVQTAGLQNEPGTSAVDAATASSADANIYAVGAYNTAVGGAAAIYKVEPSAKTPAVQTNYVGQTKGNVLNPGRTFNIGLDALRSYIKR